MIGACPSNVATTPHYSDGLLCRALFLLLLSVLILAGSPPGVAAQEEGAVLFEKPQDAVLVWVGRACLVVSLLGIGLLTWLLLFRRDRLMEAQSKWVIFLGICLLPIPVAFLNGGLGMEGSKTVEFCASCHEPMDPFVDDMRDPESDLLAAVHFKNKYIQQHQCLSCHSDYGLSGTAEAKIRGLSHIYKFTADNWEAPIALYSGTYRWSICLQCHAESQVFQKPRNDDEAHEDVLEMVMSGEAGCTDCHETAHLPPEERSER